MRISEVTCLIFLNITEIQLLGISVSWGDSQCLFPLKSVPVWVINYMVTPAITAMITIGRHISSSIHVFFPLLLVKFILKLILVPQEGLFNYVSHLWGGGSLKFYKIQTHKIMEILRLVTLCVDYYAFINTNFCYQNEGLLSRTFSA